MKKKILIGLITFVLCTIYFIVPVQAYGFNVTLTPDKRVVKKGDTVTIGIEISKIDAGDKGIINFETILDYDTSVFEELTADNIRNLNNWNCVLGSDKKTIDASLSTGYAKNNTKMCEVTLTTKTNVVVGDTTITAKNSKSSVDGKGFEVNNDFSITVNINDFTTNTYTVKKLTNNSVTRKYITGIAPNTTADMFKSKIDTGSTVSINGTVLSNITVSGTTQEGLLKTGIVSTIGSNTYIVVVRGDIGQNGKIDITDTSMMQQYIAGNLSLDAAQKEATNINGDITDKMGNWQLILEAMFKLRTLDDIGNDTTFDDTVATEK